MSDRILIGTQFYAATGDAARRQAQCSASLRSLRDADLVNVQWRDEVFESAGIDTVPVLARDAASLVGIPGRRKPIVVDLLDALARVAAERGLSSFVLVNGDVVVTQALVDRIRRERHDTWAFSRMDVDAASGRDAGIMIWGADAFAFDVAWWRVHRRRFRPYVLGEPCFDNVFAAIMLAHGDGMLANRDGEIRHERHASKWASVYSRFNFYLAALDARYFSVWARYAGALDALRRQGGSPEEEDALRRRAFVVHRSPVGALTDVARAVRARWRYTRDLKELNATAAAAPR